MLDILIDTLKDGLRLIPFLFIAFLIIELLEHKMNDKTKKMISSSGKIGPLIGGILGVFPQCGFSVMATNLYVTRIISLGTLISIYLSTSDEMLPILLSEKVEGSIIIKILGIKLLIGIVCGFIIDLVIRNRKVTNFEICDEEHCHCKNGILLSTIKHTLNTLLFIMIISFALNFLLEFVHEDIINKLFLKNSILGPFISSLIGLIPNCGASVMLTELYLKGAINLGSAIGGLLTGSGIALLVLFKSNKNIKENIMILLLVYLIGSISGILIELMGVL